MKDTDPIVCEFTVVSFFISVYLVQIISCNAHSTRPVKAHHKDRADIWAIQELFPVAVAVSS